MSLNIIDTLIAAGADALELGIPFSDPLADGPTIQNAALRAFAAVSLRVFVLKYWPKSAKTPHNTYWPVDVCKSGIPQWY